MSHLLIIAIWLLNADVVQAERPLCTADSIRATMDKLVYEYEPVEVYYSDGAADGSVVTAGPDYSPHPGIRPVLDCIHAAAPVLVEILDDPRPTGFLFRTGENNLVLRQASIGHIALDLLIVTAPPRNGVQVPDCHNDGLGACVRDGYYFRPDAWRETETSFVAAPEVGKVKARWQALLTAGRLELEIPDWMNDGNEP